MNKKQDDDIFISKAAPLGELSAKEEHLLTEYAEILLGLRQKFSSTIHGDTDEEKRYNALFLLHFVYRYIYGIKSYKDAIKHLDIFEDEKNHLKFIKKDVYIAAISRKNDGKFQLTGIKDILYFAYSDIDLRTPTGIMDAYKYLIDNASSSRTKGMAKQQLNRITALRDADAIPIDLFEWE